MARTVTVRDIARGASVSIATVSRVLNNQHNTKAEVKERVLKVATELGYFQTSRASRSGNETTLKEVGFLLDYNGFEEPLLDPFWGRILYGAETEALNANMRVTYQGIRHQLEYDLKQMLYEKQFEGILLVGPAGEETIRQIQEAQLPFVLVDNYVRLPGRQVDAVLSDNFEGAKESVAYLLAEGHRSIAFLGAYHKSGPDQRQRVYSFERRKDGYMVALRQAQIPFTEDLLEEGYIGSYEEVFEACQRLLSKHTDLSALVCASDLQAILAMKALYTLGKRVPEDISIIGFDDVDLAQHLTPALTTVRVNREAMGVVAVKSLVARMASPQAACVTSIVEVELIKRNSVAAHREI